MKHGTANCRRQHLLSQDVRQVLRRDYDPISTQDGNETWARLQQVDAPQLAILDWVMRGISGPEICRRVRQSSRLRSMYLIILTARNSAADVVSGLRAGADDYITKPFDPEELRARVKVGRRVVDLRKSLAEQSAELNKSVEREKQLQELLFGFPWNRGALAHEKDSVGIEPSVSRHCTLKMAHVKVAANVPIALTSS